MKRKITQKRLRELYNYDPKSGVWTWVVNKSRARKGEIAGHVRKCDGYRVLYVDQQQERAGRLAWLYVYGELPESQIDHINHNRSDDRLENLRVVDLAGNNKNLSMRKKNNSGQTGVYWDKTNKLWVAQIGINGHNKHMYSGKNKHKAIAVRRAAEVVYGYHKNHGAASPCV